MYLNLSYLNNNGELENEEILDSSLTPVEKLDYGWTTGNLQSRDYTFTTLGFNATPITFKDGDILYIPKL